MPTNYEPSDGDYIEADYTKFFNDIQVEAEYDFGEYPEICTSLEEDNTIRVLGANDECDEWEWERSFPIPKGWELEQVKKMFEGSVYLEPRKMSKAERKQRRKALEAKGFTFKYARGNAEVGGGYAVYHKGKLVAPGREVSLDEAIEFAEQQTDTRLEIRKFLMS